MHKQLFIPGPVDVRPDVLEKMTTPLIGHRTQEIRDLQKSISDKLRQLFYTDNVILLSTSSGSGLMEAAIRSCTAKKALCCSMGSFGNRWYKMAVQNNIPAEKIEVTWGEAITPEMIDAKLATGEFDLVATTHTETSTGVTNDLVAFAAVINKYPDVIWCVDSISAAGGNKVEVDALGIDIFITSSHKALGLPPGMAVCSISEAAYKRTFDVKYRGLYLDLQDTYDFVVKKNYQYPSTPNVSLMFAMDYQLDLILAEGLDNRFARHQALAEHTRAWAEKYFALFPDIKDCGNTLTVIKNTRGINIAELNKALGERGKMISNGYGDLKEETFRIAHMAECTIADLDALFADIEELAHLND